MEKSEEGRESFVIKIFVTSTLYAIQNLGKLEKGG
jgi:hypothetical protein